MTEISEKKSAISDNKNTLDIIELRKISKDGEIAENFI